MSGYKSVGIPGATWTTASGLLGILDVGSNVEIGLEARHAVSFTMITGLPAGLSLDPLSGVISGVPQFSGTFYISCSAANAIGATSLRSFTLVINDAAHQEEPQIEEPEFEEPSAPVAQEATSGTFIP